MAFSISYYLELRCAITVTNNDVVNIVGGTYMTY